ncbi:hypothetical protein MOE90_21020 [Bacillus spizizenii]|nr:hypothetical protein [Bacillus spizizenii]MCY9125006.1 hypothetical protein [Bacillus spizizenii]
MKFTNYYSDFSKIMSQIEARNRAILRMTNSFSSAAQKSIVHMATRNSLVAPKMMIDNAIKSKIIARQNMIEKAKISISPPIIPKLPHFDIKLPKISIDFEKIEKITDHNSLHGWTLTGEIPTHIYLNEEFLTMSQEEIDNFFVSYYEEDDFKEMRGLKRTLLDGLDKKWHELIEDSFSLYEGGKFRMLIPTLMTIVEGEISEVAESAEVGGRLIGDFKNSFSSETDKLIVISCYSALKFFDKRLFKTHKFYKNRREIINRNWVLHGRDDPQKWSKADAVRLFNTLSTMQFIKSFKSELKPA